MLRTVLLRHDLPDGTWHYDWMLELPPNAGEGASAWEDPDARRLLTFRMEEKPDDPGAALLRGERLTNHRAAYLTYEGEVSGGRGWVRRVAWGTYRLLRRDEDVVDVEVMFETGESPLRIRGRRERGEIWIFSLQKAAGLGMMAEGAG